MSLVRLNIKGISYSQTQNGAYALILNEVDGDRIAEGASDSHTLAIAVTEWCLHHTNQFGHTYR